MKPDHQRLPTGARRLEIVVHSEEDVAGYLGSAANLMDEAEIPEDERPQMRLLLVQLLAQRNVQLVDERPQQPQSILPIAMPGGLIPGIR